MKERFWVEVNDSIGNSTVQALQSRSCFGSFATMFLHVLTL